MAYEYPNQIGNKEEIESFNEANREDRFGTPEIDKKYDFELFPDSNKIKAVKEIKTGNLNTSSGDNTDILFEYNIALMYLEACLTVLNTVPNKKIKTPISSNTYELAAKVSRFIKGE